jgi:ubiquinone/menaquinone biosynthesis C-methylase UbiE
MNDELKFFTDGPAYERHMGRWSQLVAGKFLEWLGAPSGSRWLDVGCGNGAFSEVLMARCPPAELQGIDPSDAQIAYARSRPSLNTAQFQTGDAQSLPFPNQRFDVATMALVISFLPDPARAVGEMARVVRRGGYVASYMWDIPGGGLPQQAISTAAQTLGLSAGFKPPMAQNKVHTFADLEAMWQAAGLQEVETRRIDIAAVYSDFDDFWESSIVMASPIGNLVLALSPPDRDRLKEYLRDSLSRDADGHVIRPAFVNAVKGRVHS